MASYSNHTLPYNVNILESNVYTTYSTIDFPEPFQNRLHFNTLPQFLSSSPLNILRHFPQYWKRPVLLLWQHKFCRHERSVEAENCY